MSSTKSNLKGTAPRLVFTDLETQPCLVCCRPTSNYTLLSRGFKSLPCFVCDSCKHTPWKTILVLAMDAEREPLARAIQIANSPFTK